MVFEQQWAFFAPPPTGNNRLYYNFFDKEDKLIRTFEVLQPLLKEKQQKQPFNVREEAVDYIVNGSIMNSMDYIFDQRDIYTNLYPDSTLLWRDAESRKAITAMHDKLPPLITLKNYCKIVAKKNLSQEDYDRIDNYIITISEIKIPKFVNREQLLQDQTTTKEGIVLETSRLKFRI